MKFELKPYSGTLTDNEILDDIRRVAVENNTDYISLSLYKKQGKYSQCAIQNHFSTWTNALALAGLRTARNSAELKHISDQEYAADLRRVALLNKSGTVLYEDYKKNGQYSAEHIFNRFEDWDQALIYAGLKPTGLARKKISEQACLEEIERLWIQLGKQPTRSDVDAYSKYSIDTFKRRFGGWRKALEAFVVYMNQNIDEETSTDRADETQNTINIQEEVFEESGIKRHSIKHRTTRNIGAKLRFKVLQRDCFKCCACGASPAKNPAVVLHVDHVVPWAKGGETEIDNLQTLCETCNLGKSDM